MTLLGVIGFKIVITDTYLHYVNAWMKWPILAASVVLVAVSVRYLFGKTLDPDPDPDSGKDDIKVPAVTWLLLLPVLVLFVIAPPELGAYAAERRTGTNALRPSTSAGTDTGAMAMGETPVSEFVALAQWEPAADLRDRQIALTGFVSRGPSDAWYVTRLGISCCAADAIGWRVRVEGAAAPQRDQWVRVTGTWIDPHKTVPRIGDTAITATDVKFVPEPKTTYE